MKAKSCEVVQDLLPLYHDGVCSPGSRELVEDHLKTCPDCRQALADLDAPLPEPAGKIADDAAVVRKISEEWKKSKWRARMRGAAVAAATCAVLFGGWYGLTQWMICPVPIEKIEITNVRQLKDGRIVYHFYIADDLNLRYTRYEYDEQGNKYFVPLRAPIMEKRWDGTSPANRDIVMDLAEENTWARSRGVDREVTRAWYGEGEDKILLWEEGMDLPAASAEDEAAYGYETGSAEYWAARTGS